MRPVPGVAGGLDGQVGRRERVLEVEELEGGDGDRHQDQDRDHRPQHLERGVVRGARRRRVALLAEPPHHVQHAAASTNAVIEEDDDVDVVVHPMDVVGDRRDGFLKADLLGWAGPSPPRPAPRTPGRPSSESPASSGRSGAAGSSISLPASGRHAVATAAHSAASTAAGARRHSYLTNCPAVPCGIGPSQQVAHPADLPGHCPSGHQTTQWPIPT